MTEGITTFTFTSLKEHDSQVAKAERERVFTLIGYVDEGGCPYDSCRHRSEATNCRDCLIDWLKKELRREQP
jgi:hypothetical protein